MDLRATAGFLQPAAPYFLWRVVAGAERHDAVRSDPVQTNVVVFRYRVKASFIWFFFGRYLCTGARLSPRSATCIRSTAYGHRAMSCYPQNPE